MQKKYQVKNLTFLFLGLVVSLIIGKYGLFQGIILTGFTIMWFCYETIFYKEWHRGKEQTPKEKLDLMEKSVPFPFLILDGNKVVYSSESFKSIYNFRGERIITDIVPDFGFAVKCQTIFLNGKGYTLYSSLINYRGRVNANIVFFVDRKNEVSVLNNNISVIVSLILIDNFGDVLEEVEEIRRPLLVALIDRKLNTLAQQVGGIVRKFEKDQYIFIFAKDKLDYLKEKKFDILDKIREIDMGNKVPVTLSIGMGLSDTSISKAMEYARQALDLALGRGGDQVLIKDSDKFYFYGGKSTEVGTNTRVRARVKAYALGELIEESSDVLVMGHRNTDLDCLGSSIGVYTIVRAFGKTGNIVLNGVTSSVNILYDRLMKEAEYNNGTFISSEKALEKITPNTLLVVVDAHRPSILESSALLEKAKKIVVFDHHRKSAEFIENAVLSYHEPYASSTSELVTEMLLYTKHQVNLLPVEADALLAGITVDTKNFAFKTGAKTFEAAAFLRRKGADSIRVRLLFQNKMEAYKAKAMAVNNAEIFNDNMAISSCPSGMENPTLVTAQAADDLLNIYGIVASFVLCEDKDKVIISARSLGSVNVQVIMEKIGGGGHQTVAGAQLNNTSLEDALDLLRDAIAKYIQEGTK